MTDHQSSTAKPYLQDPYTVEFDATVLSCAERPEGGFDVVLDRTFFYPESGGQQSDRGTVSGAEVGDVWEDEEGIVHHLVTRAVSPGRTGCRVDWPRRFDHMQQHTGQHVLSRAFVEVGRLETVSFHMGDEHCTIDLAGPVADTAVFDEAETLANRVIWEDREVTIRNVARDEIVEDTLRKKLPDGVTGVRLVDIAAFDVIGCCGTHVRSTGELGVIKVLKHDKAKGAQRVSFKVGRRAFDDYRTKHGVVSALAKRFTTSVDALEAKVDKLHTSSRLNRKMLEKLSRRLAVFEAGRLLESARARDDKRFVVAVCDDADAAYLRALGSELKNTGRLVTILGSPDGSVVCYASADLAVDFASVVERAKTLGGSGGGKGGFATVTLPASTDVPAFLEDAFEELT